MTTSSVELIRAEEEDIGEETGADEEPITPMTEEQGRLIEEAHSFGHFGVTATMFKLREAGQAWRGMGKMVEGALQSCVACQKWTVVKRSFAPL